MTPEEKSLLERTLKLTQENNSLLRGLRRSNRVSTLLRVLYWAIIIGLSFGAFYLIQPYFTLLTGITSGSLNTGGISQSGASSTMQTAATSLKEFLQGH